MAIEIVVCKEELAGKTLDYDKVIKREIVTSKDDLDKVLVNLRNSSAKKKESVVFLFFVLDIRMKGANVDPKIERTNVDLGGATNYLEGTKIAGIIRTLINQNKIKTRNLLEFESLPLEVKPIK
jgi:hypothetical protein